ncbi:MAG: hypothetical protein QGH40_11780 [bacterium]|nr:hypothetical protein [bacterium]
MTGLKAFVADLLEAAGAVVETPEPDILEVLSPEPVQHILRIPEFARLGFGPATPGEAEPVTLESDWMDRLEHLLGSRGRRMRLVLNMPHSPPGHPERVIEHTFTLHNAVYHLQNIRPAWTRYLVFNFRYSACSDEKRDGLLWTGFNLATGSIDVNPLEDWMEFALDHNVERLPVPPEGTGLPSGWEPGRVSAVLKHALPELVRTRLAPFVAGMGRRQKRDLARLHSYYTGLQAEAWQRLRTLSKKDELSRRQAGALEREKHRLEAIDREYRAKVSDLRRKYEMTVELEWVQTMELDMPVERFELLIKRRKGRRCLEVDWNPRTRRLEPPPCEYSFTPQASFVVCDEKLHLVGSVYAGPCPRCGRDFCRVCHPVRCPRCDHRQPEN